MSQRRETRVVRGVEKSEGLSERKSRELGRKNEKR